MIKAHVETMLRNVLENKVGKTLEKGKVDRNIFPK